MGAYSEAIGAGLAPVLQQHAIARAARKAFLRGPARPPQSAEELSKRRGGRSCEGEERQEEDTFLDGETELATSVYAQVAPVIECVSRISSEVGEARGAQASMRIKDLGIYCIICIFGCWDLF